MKRLLYRLRGAPLGAVLLVFATLLYPVGPSTAAVATLPPLPSTAKAAHPKLDSQLATLVSQLGSRSARDLAATAPVSQGETIGVTVRLANPSVTATVQAYVIAHGGTIAHAVKDIIEAYLPITILDNVSTLPGVLKIDQIIPPLATVTDPGATIHNAVNWNAAGYTGTGIRVGVVDGGFIGYSSLIGSVVTTPAAAHCYTAVGVFTTNLVDCQANTQHGTGVVETVIDVAPAVTLYLADPISATDFHDAVNWMVSQGVQIINYSVGWTSYWGPGDGTSPYTNSPFDTVNNAVAGGIVFVNSAGNDGNGSWIGPYSGSVGSFLNFSGPSTSANGVNLTAGTTVAIRARWADSWTAAATDIDLALYYWNGTSLQLVASSQSTQNGQLGQTPSEFISYAVPVTGLYAVALYHYAGAAPAWLQVQVSNGPVLQYQNKASSIGIPAESANPGMLAVGAASYLTPTTIETYSSEGPTIDNRIKPDIVGVDCGPTVSEPTFCGTSQASPHVAGLAALVRQRFPAFTPVQVASYLKTNALGRSSPVPNDIWGSGLGFAPMSVSLINPTSGPLAGGGKMQITGVGIGATTAVAIKGNPCLAVAVVSGTTISCSTPAGTAGMADVTLATNGGTMTLSNAYQYISVNALPSPQPSAGAVGGVQPLPVRQPQVPITGSPSPLPAPR